LGTSKFIKLPNTERDSAFLQGFVPYMGRLPYMRILPICGKSSGMWEDFAYMGRLPMYGKTSHIWEDFPRMGRHPIYVEV
jgi:hypothetical protein